MPHVDRRLWNRRASATEKPLRDELLSIERLEERASALAATFTIDPNPRRRARNIFPRFEDNVRVLRAAYRTFADDVRTGHFVAATAEWLLDNFHLVTAEVTDIRRNLPDAYFRDLPTLAARERAGYARIYAVAVELVRHSDSRLERQQLTQFLDSYQRLAPLTIGELWAWPSMLKLALIENLRRLAEEMLSARSEREAADSYISRLDQEADQAVPVLPPFLDAAFVVQLLHRLREYGLRLLPIRTAVDEHLASRQTTAEEAIRAEHQRQSVSQVSVANAITSLRLCGTLDWQTYVESVSLVEQVLRRDPGGAYTRMDFLSRDQQRHAIEQLAAPSGEAQVRVALRAVESARHAAAGGSTADRAAHVGYHLIGRGRRDLEADVGYQPRVVERAARVLFAHATLLYLGMIAILTAIFVAAGLEYARHAGGSPAARAAVACLLLLPASDFAILCIQQATSRLIRPKRLPRLDFSTGVPEHARTMVIVPTMLTSIAGVDALVEHLEVLALGNLDPCVHFAILSDFPDTSTSDVPEDAAALERARAGVQRLNVKLGSDDRFFLFHRDRQWNVSEKAWIGWERKRGKIEEFNRLLRGATDTSFSTQVGQLDVLSSVRYCLTLDSDTRLPRDTARKLIGIIAHPLNQPHFDAQRGRVTEGYGILQPRVSVTMASAAGSLFARTYAGHTGVDRYTTAVSDLYQDLFDEGIFTGKGLYDVDAFVSALEGRVPENALLSHDLFEGLYARTALVSDLELVDDYPSSVLAHARRQHRWVRGDWQILWWLFPFVPSRSGLRRNRLPLMLLDESCRLAVRCQQQYAADRGVPWDISESAYNLVDRHANYQYKAFGIPGLGVDTRVGRRGRRGAYATALALTIDPRASTANLRHLALMGLESDYGFFDAIDFTNRESEPTLPGGHGAGVIVQVYLAHHEGMTLVALANALAGDRMVQRFHADPRVQATALLLQERVPRQSPSIDPRPLDEMRAPAPPPPVPVRRYRTAHTAVPHTQFLSNGNYVTAVTNAGGGGSVYRDLVVTRWRRDATRDAGGQFIYLRDVRARDRVVCDVSTDATGA